MLNLIKGKGFYKTNIKPPEELRKFLEGLEIEETHPDQFYDCLDTKNVEFPQKWVDLLVDPVKCDDFLASFIPHAQVRCNMAYKNHFSPPHMDMSPYSPWIIQYFVSRRDLNWTGFHLLAGDKDSYERIPIYSGDLFVFYTYPSDFIFSLTELQKENCIVTSVLPCMTENFCDNWVFKDADPEIDWPRI